MEQVPMPDFEELMEKVNVIVGIPGTKAVAPLVNKKYSTLRNEISGQGEAKLGLETFVRIVQVTRDFRALDWIEDLLGRVAFLRPTGEPGDPVDLMKFTAQLAFNFSGVMDETAKALDDKKLDGNEAEQILAQLDDLEKTVVQVRFYLESVENK
ncbi:phage regulatory CII family protein [Desulfatibacillum aliphaticivorans]|uniref:phage regulatory CII family protein n=1 Tax=Desulfatibacillum aliphaticivorans TaxID=218208 RepID=UPI0003F4D6B2|nr:phage regulatory CII family protein [Desulfatibacillum aliphaticivorans]